jgi:hypothetical protein
MTAKPSPAPTPAETDAADQKAERFVVRGQKTLRVSTQCYVYDRQRKGRVGRSMSRRQAEASARSLNNTIGWLPE